jgi:DNA-binding transcriptional LysR family regulator
LLPSLVALVEEASVTRAARRLRISQPRMSARLAELRGLLGDPVLIAASRTRGLMPTVRATELAAAARAGLAGLTAAFASPSFDPQQSERVFRIMANENATIMVGLKLLRAVRALGGSRLRVALYAYDAARLGELEHGALDLVLGRPNQFAELPALVTRPVVRDAFSTVANAATGLGGMDLDCFCARDHLLISTKGGNFDGAIDAELATLGRRRNVVASVQSHLLAIELVAQTDLIATVPQALLASRRHQLAVFPPPLDVGAFVVTAAWHPRLANDPAHQWLRGVMFGLQAG